MSFTSVQFADVITVAEKLKQATCQYIPYDKAVKITDAYKVPSQV